jgi:hypothetical protein
VRRLKALFRRSPFSRLSLRRCTGLEGWLRRIPIGLFDAVADAKQWWEVSEREPHEHFDELPYYKPRALSCALPLLVFHG